MQMHFETEDMELDNEIKNRVEERIAQCDRDINHKGDQASQIEETVPLHDKSRSLFVRRKHILNEINQVVNSYNDNNKLVRESNKLQKPDSELNDLIGRNQEIQRENEEVEKLINDALLFADQIEEKLKALLEPVMPEIREKYDDKNALIDECDELFDDCEQQVKQLEKSIGESLKKADEIIAKLDHASPLAHPSSAKQNNAEFLNQISGRLDKAFEARTQVEAAKARLNSAKDELQEDIEPLNQLGDREVRQPEIERVKAALRQVSEELADLGTDLSPCIEDLQNLDSELDDMLNKEKEQKILHAGDLLRDLDAAIKDLAGRKKDAEEKLALYKKLIAEAKKDEGKEDPVLLEQLKKLENEAAEIERDLKEINEKADSLAKKRAEFKEQLEKAQADPDQFQP